MYFACGEQLELVSHPLAPASLHPKPDWIACGFAIFSAKRKIMIKHLQCEAHRTRSPVEVQHGSSPQAILPAALHPSEASPKSDKNIQASSMRSPLDQISRWGSAWLFLSGHINAKPTGPDQPLRSSIALPIRPYYPQRFIHGSTTLIRQKRSSIFNAKPTGPDQPLRFSMALPLRPSMRSPLDQISCWSSAWLFPSGHITRSASSIRSFTKIRQKCSSIFNANPPDQISRWGSAWFVPLGRQCEVPDLISRWGSAWLFPSGHITQNASYIRSCTQIRQKCQASSTRSPPDQISRWGWAWRFLSGHITRSASSIRSFIQIQQKCSSIFNAKPTGRDQPLRFSMALSLRPSMRSPPDQISRWGSAWLLDSRHITRSTSSSRSFTQIRQNAQASSVRSPPDHLRRLRSSMVHLMPKRFLPSPTVCQLGGGPGGNRSPTVT